MVVQGWAMARISIDLDESALAAVMVRYRLTTRQEAVNFALRSLAAEPMPIERARAMRGTGWDDDLDELRGTRPA